MVFVKIKMLIKEATIVTPHISTVQKNKLTTDNIKLALFDIDGTLKNSQDQISQATIYAINQLKDNGCKIGFASGRPLCAVDDVWASIQVDAPSILFSGALVVDQSRHVLQEVTLDVVMAKKLLEACRRLGLSLEFESRNSIFAETSTELLKIRWSYFTDPATQINDLSRVLISERIIKASIALNPATEQVKFEQLKKQFPDFNYGIGRGAAHPDLAFINITAKHCSTTSALNRVLDTLNINASQVISFGDGDSDIPLLQAVGCGIAMGNAYAPVKRAANYVTDSVDENGIAVAVEAII